MTSVLVVEDDAGTRAALVEVLRFVGYTTVEASSGREALAVVRAAQPDLVVVDMGLPDMDGTEVVVALRQMSNAPMVVVSGSRRVHRKADALEAGADDFLDKPFDVSELRARLRAAERRVGRQSADAGQRRFGDLDVDLTGRTLSRDGQEIRLTDIEWRLLDALSSEAGQVVTHRRLATVVWGPGAGREVQPSLRTHVRSLRRKIGDDVRDPRFIRADSGVGYRWIAMSPRPGQDPTDMSMMDRAVGLRDELAGLKHPDGEAESEAVQRAAELAEALVHTLEGL